MKETATVAGGEADVAAPAAVERAGGDAAPGGEEGQVGAVEHLGGKGRDLDLLVADGQPEVDAVDRQMVGDSERRNPRRAVVELRRGDVQTRLYGKDVLPGPSGEQAAMIQQAISEIEALGPKATYEYELRARTTPGQHPMPCNMSPAGTTRGVSA